MAKLSSRKQPRRLTAPFESEEDCKLDRTLPGGLCC